MTHHLIDQAEEGSVEGEYALEVALLMSYKIDSNDIKGVT